MAEQPQYALRMRMPFAQPEAAATLNLLLTAARFQNWFGRSIRRFGMTSSQYNMLRILRGESQPMPSLEIADRMAQVVPSITGLIDRLKNQELVTWHACLEDRRIESVELTTQAVQPLAEIDEPDTAMHCQLIGHLSGTELNELSRLQEKARESLCAEES